MNVPLETSVCEEKNYQSVYELHGKAIRNFVYYKCGDLEQAEDIAQEAYIRLWENCKNVVMEKVKSFLYTVAMRLFVDASRHQKVQLNFVKHSGSPVNREDPAFLLREEEFKKHLEAAIAALPETQREVFLMHRIDKMSYEEMAECLGITVKAIEKRMHQALATLKDRVKELDYHKI